MPRKTASSRKKPNTSTKVKQGTKKEGKQGETKTATQPAPSADLQTTDLPATDSSSPANQATKTPLPHRRGFFRHCFGSFAAIGGLSLAATCLLWLFGTLRFLFSNVQPRVAQPFRVGPPSLFPLGTVETRFKKEYGIWVVHARYQGKPQVYALQAVCTHLGCTPNWQASDETFWCPCHGSGFDKNGINVTGPAPRPLARYAIRLTDDGELEIDKSKTFQQELGEWQDPESFVTLEAGQGGGSRNG